MCIVKGAGDYDTIKEEESSSAKKTTEIKTVDIESLKEPEPVAKKESPKKSIKTDAPVTKKLTLKKVPNRIVPFSLSPTLLPLTFFIIYLIVDLCHIGNKIDDTLQSSTNV